jgi:anti-sigma regulatory factor (Ser/Thr protein kinase)
VTTLQLRYDDPDGDHVAAVRTRVRGWTEERGLPTAVAEIVLLAVSELVTNAIRHARTGFELTLVADPGCVELRVFDADPAQPTLAPRDIDAVGGRGLQIVAGLATRWGSEPDERRGLGGKVVWAQFDVDRGPPARFGRRDHGSD